MLHICCVGVPTIQSCVRARVKVKVIVMVGVRTRD